MGSIATVSPEIGRVGQLCEYIGREEGNSLLGALQQFLARRCLISGRVIREHYLQAMDIKVMADAFGLRLVESEPPTSHRWVTGVVVGEVTGDAVRHVLSPVRSGPICYVEFVAMVDPEVDGVARTRRI